MRSICFVHKDIGDIDRGGICVLFKTMIAGLVDRGWKVSCITQRKLSLPQVNTIVLPLIQDPILYSTEVSKTIGKINPDIVECSNWRFELLDYSENKLRTAKIVVRSDPSATTLFGHRLRGLVKFEKKLCVNADHVMAVSNFAKKDITKTYSISNVSVVYNGVDVSALGANNQNKIPKCIVSDKINVFWCGKPTRMKGFDLLKKIINRSPDNINWILNLGDSVSEISTRGLNSKNLTIVNKLARSDQISIWKNCDVFLSTSRIEGFGLALAEALALGLPAIVNKDCRVYREFMPSEAIKLLDPSIVSDVFMAVKDASNNKVGYDRLNPEFHATNMINGSLKIYNTL
jgi:D-inositol-3-phosphate glycosyltransferase